MNLNDDLSDLLGGARKDKPLADHTPDWYRNQAPATHIEVCPRCHGSGRAFGGICFKCQGAGKKSYRNPADVRAKARQQAATRKATSEAERVVAFKTAQPEIWAWLEKNPAFEFAASLRNAIARFGDLTDGQLAAVQKLMARDAQRTAERAARIEQAPVVETAGVDRLKAAFDHAITRAAEKGRGLKQPRITIGCTVISPAGANSANPGALYVKDGGTYLGKIKDGRFYASRECSKEQETRVLAFVADPKAAAEAYGVETGVCCICNATLTNKESIERGIGPICAQNFGW